MLRASLGALLGLALAVQPPVRAVAATAPPPVRAEIEVRIDPGTREFTGRGTWLVALGRPWRVTLDERFEVHRFVVDGDPGPAAAALVEGLQGWRLPAAPRERRIEIAWRGRLDALDATLDHRAVLRHADPVSSPRGTFLPAAARWHPVFEGAGLAYRIAIDLPDEQHAIVPGTPAGERTGGRRRVQTYVFEQPEAAIDLMAGPYRVTQRSFAAADGREITLRALLHPEIADRGDGDLDAIERYLRLYEAWIGPYPYDAFSVVSSPTPTGFGMPTLTYLGVEVLRLPFIRDTSLGHEVLHNWWGNGVRPDYGRGNWSEGLTTFMADYTYREQASAEAAREMRLAWLRDFAALGSAADRPLAAFTSRTHGAEQVVGYHKAAMVFLMLRDAIGTDAFDRALRAFWREHRGGGASWADLRAAFEAASKRDLGPYFAQWLERAGAPSLRLAAATAVRVGAGWRVEVELTQSAPAYRLRVPLALGFEGGTEETHWVDFNGERGHFRLAADRRPTGITLDPQARVFRRLGPGEAPPILRQSMLDPATVTVLVGAEPAAESLARRLTEHPLQLLPATATPPAQPLLLVGLAPEVDRYLARHALPRRPAELGAAGGTATAWVWTTERRGGAPLTVVAARDATALTALARPLPHYGRQSWLVFEGPTATARGVWPSRPQRVAFDGG
jgi:aminopeptidase N